MRYSTTLVLSTLAVGQAAAAAHGSRHAHAGFHARRSAEEKREVDYNNKELYKDVDWTKVEWNKVFGLANENDKPTPTPAPKVVEVAQDYKQKKPTAPAPAPSKAPEPVKEKKPKKEGEDKSPLDKGGDFLEGLVDGIEEWCKEKGISGPGKNDKSSNEGLWLGPSQWQANFHNAGSENMWLACWQEKSFTGMTINVNRPEILIKIPVGGNQTVSYTPGVSSACGPMYPDTILDYGIIYNTWFEATFGDWGTFDVSKNTCMNGDSIEAVGSKCTSNMNTCVFECKDKSAKKCTTGYDLVNCEDSNGGGGGYDPVMAGIGGGCSMGAQGEKLEVTFSN